MAFTAPHSITELLVPDWVASRSCFPFLSHCCISVSHVTRPETLQGAFRLYLTCDLPKNYEYFNICLKRGVFESHEQRVFYFS